MNKEKQPKKKAINSSIEPVKQGRSWKLASNTLKSRASGRTGLPILKEANSNIQISFEYLTRVIKQKRNV